MNKKQLIVICVSIVLMVLSGCDEQLSRVGSGMKDLKNAWEVKSLDGTWEIIFVDENGRLVYTTDEKLFYDQSDFSIPVQNEQLRPFLFQYKVDDNVNILVSCFEV